MRLIYADYNPQTNSIDVTTFENYIIRIDCNKAEDGLRTTPCSQNSLNALAIDEPLEYARHAIDREMQAWVDAIDNLDFLLICNILYDVNCLYIVPVKKCRWIKSVLFDLIKANFCEI